MNKRIPRILACASLLLLSSCAGGRILYLFEQPYWSVLGGNAILHARLAAFALAHGKLATLDVTRAGSDARSELTRALVAGRYGTVVVGPLLSLDTQQIAHDHPRVRFILIHAVAQVADIPSNVTALTFDRRDAFRTAGRIATLVAEKQPSDDADASSVVGILASADSDLSPDEVGAFRDGATAYSSVKDVITQTVKSPSDSGAVQLAIEAMRHNGVGVFLLSLGSANPTALDALKTAGGVAVVGDWARAWLDPAQVLVSVETEEADGVMRAVAAKQERLVAGKVHLVLGGAGPIPTEARALLEAQR